MTAPAAGAASPSDALEIARRFVAARHKASAITVFPGDVPATLEAGYRIQDAAIPLWPDKIVGWKVGRIPPDPSRPGPAERLSGPIFSRAVQSATSSAPARFGVIDGGFCAVEAEFVFRLSADAPEGKTDWTDAEAEEVAGALFVGVEIAGSPLASINRLGPPVVVADFGNNAGLILGPEITGWRGRDPASLPCETFIDEASVGRGSAASLENGPLGSLTYLLALCARRGRPLRAGMYVATGQTTGIHDIRPGQTARVAFPGIGEILCLAEPARPLDETMRP